MGVERDPGCAEQRRDQVRRSSPSDQGSSVRFGDRRPPTCSSATTRSPPGARCASRSRARGPRRERASPPLGAASRAIGGARAGTSAQPGPCATRRRLRAARTVRWFALRDAREPPGVPACVSRRSAADPHRRELGRPRRGQFAWLGPERRCASSIAFRAALRPHGPGDRADAFDPASRRYSSAPYIAVASRGVEGHGPVKPRQPPARLGLREKVPSPSRCAVEPPGASVTAAEARTVYKEELHMAVEALKCKECFDQYPLEALYVCDKCFGPLEVAYDFSGLDAGGDPAQDPGRPALDLALRRLPAVRAARRRRALDGGHDAAGPGRPAGGAARHRRGVGQERRRQPDALLQGPGREPSRSPRRASWATRWSPAPPPATSRTRWPRTPRRLGSSRTSSFPPDLEEQKVLATGVYGTQPRRRAAATTTTSTGSAPSSRASATVGVRERERAALLRGGLEDARVTRSPSSSASSCPTGWSRRSRPARCSRRSRAASRSGSRSG